MANKNAEESESTKKARQKLQKRLGIIDEKMTPEALEQKTDEIHRWISRHSKNRVVLKKKSISLFDGNKHAAKMSAKTQKMADDLAEDQ